MQRRAIGSLVLIGASVVAIGLGAHGVAHPGLISASGGVNAGSTPAVSSGSGSGTSAANHTAASSSNRSASSSASSSSSKTMKATKTRLSQSPYAQVAVKIYPGSLTTAAKSALAGFTMGIKKLSNSQIQVSLQIQGQQGSPYTKTVSASDHVYFVETSLGDDGQGQDLNLGDDGVIYTNAGGYILQ